MGGGGGGGPTIWKLHECWSSRFPVKKADFGLTWGVNYGKLTFFPIKLSLRDVRKHSQTVLVISF